jgi:hypothetical protein
LPSAEIIYTPPRGIFEFAFRFNNREEYDLMDKVLKASF